MAKEASDIVSHQGHDSRWTRLVLAEGRGRAKRIGCCLLVDREHAENGLLGGLGQRWQGESQTHPGTVFRLRRDGINHTWMKLRLVPLVIAVVVIALLGVSAVASREQLYDGIQVHVL